MLKNFTYFSNKVDREVMDQCGPYDKILVYASTLRLVITVVFVFCISLYGLSTLLPELWMAAALAILIAAAVYGFDTAILGFEWTLHREVSRYWFINGPAVFLIKLIQLSPRLLYAIVIATGVAALAEIEFQSKAIDRTLRESTRELNREYLDAVKIIEDRYLESIKGVEEDIEKTERALEAKADPTTSQELDRLNGLIPSLQTDIRTYTTQLTSLRDRLAEEEALIGPLRSEVSSLRRTRDELQKKMDEELKPPRCLTDDKAVCRGDNWKRFRNQHREADESYSLKFSLLEPKEKLIQQLRQQEQEAAQSKETATNNFNSTRSSIQKIDGDGRGITELSGALQTLESNRSNLITERNEELKSKKEELKNAGLYDPAEYDIFDRYVGLRALHRAPSEQGSRSDEEFDLAVYRANSAREISYGIMAVIIAIELIPAFIVVFFQPFSFYASKMREKRDIEIHAQEKRRINREISLEITKRKHRAELLNQRAKAYGAKQDFRKRKFEMKTDATTAIKDKKTSVSDENVERKISLQDKIIELQRKMRDRIFSERMTRDVKDELSS